MENISELVVSPKVERAMASKGEVGEVLWAMKDEGNYVATTPLLSMACKPGGSASSPKECLDKDYIPHGHHITKEGDVLVASNSCADMLDIENVKQSLMGLVGELQDVRMSTMDGMNPTTTGFHKVKDANAKGNHLLQVANLIQNATPKTSYSLPAIVVGHDTMDPMLYPESLEFVVKELQQGSLGKKNMSQLFQFLHLLGSDLLDIAT